MDEGRLVKFELNQLQRIGNSIKISNKLILSESLRLIPYRKGDKWGYCSFDKKIKIECIYDFARAFSNGIAIVRLNSKYGIINELGQHITECKFNEFWDFKEELAVVKFNQKFGFVDSNGNFRIPLLYDNANSFEHGRAKVFLKNKSCFVDNLGDKISEWIDDLTYTRHGHTLPAIHLFDENMFLLLESLPDIDYNLINGMTIIEKNGKFGFKNIFNIEVIPCKYEFVQPFSLEISMVKLNQKLGYINKMGIEYWED